MAACSQIITSTFLSSFISVAAYIPDSDNLLVDFLRFMSMTQRQLRKGILNVALAVVRHYLRVAQLERNATFREGEVNVSSRYNLRDDI
jgi:hypothetical protein